MTDELVQNRRFTTRGARRRNPSTSENEIITNFGFTPSNIGTGIGFNQRHLEETPDSGVEYLLAFLDLWTFELPALKHRREDIEPNLAFELVRFAERKGVRATFNREARERYLAFARSNRAIWRANFRDLGASYDFPAPVGPMSNSSAFDSSAICSMRSIIRLNASLRVAMPNFSKDVACAFSAAKCVTRMGQSPKFGPTRSFHQMTAQALYRPRPVNSRRFDESSSIIVVAAC